MATIEEHVQALLVAALPAYGSPASEVVAAGRIKPQGDWQNLARPYVVHFPVSVDPIYTHAGRAKLLPWRFYQVSVIAGDGSPSNKSAYSQASTIARAIVDILSGTHGQATFFWRGMNALPFDFDRKVIEIALDFEVFEAL